MKEKIYDVIAWGTVMVHGDKYYLLSPRPYSSEVVDGGVGRSVWQQEGTLKWEVANQYTERFVGTTTEWLYERSIIVFGSDALIEFYQNPQTIKVNYVFPEQEDDNENVAVSPTN